MNLQGCFLGILSSVCRPRAEFLRISVIETCSFAKGGQRSPRRCAMALRSQLFRGDQKLEAAAASDPAHVTPGAAGVLVGKIQTALLLLDDAAIAGSEKDGLR